MSKWITAVNRAIIRNKRTCNYIAKSKAGYNPSLGTNVVTETTTSIDCARDTTRKSQYSENGIVLVDKTVFYVSAGAAVVPKANDIIQDDTDKFTIDKVDKHFAGGQVVMYVCYCNS